MRNPAESDEAQHRASKPAVVPIHRLRGTVLGLVGFGRIPQLVAPKAKSFGFGRGLHLDPYVPQTVYDQAGVQRVEFAELLKISDYISIHTPLLPETRHLFTAHISPDETRISDRKYFARTRGG